MASDDLSRERAIRAEALKAAAAYKDEGNSVDVVAHLFAHWIQTGERQYMTKLMSYSHDWCSLGDKCWYWKTGEAR